MGRSWGDRAVLESLELKAAKLAMPERAMAGCGGPNR